MAFRNSPAMKPYHQVSEVNGRKPRSCHWQVLIAPDPRNPLARHVSFRRRKRGLRARLNDADASGQFLQVDPAALRHDRQLPPRPRITRAHAEHTPHTQGLHTRVCAETESTILQLNPQPRARSEQQRGSGVRRLPHHAFRIL
eukprot:scaffold2506_cov236-Pinguiococcus_pyrenoidosus.AAC.13